MPESRGHITYLPRITASGRVSGAAGGGRSEARRPGRRRGCSTRPVTSPLPDPHRRGGATLRNATASAMCGRATVSALSRSAMVRATRRMRL